MTQLRYYPAVQLPFSAGRQINHTALTQLGSEELVGTNCLGLRSGIIRVLREH